MHEPSVHLVTTELFRYFYLSLPKKSQPFWLTDFRRFQLYSMRSVAAIFTFSWYKLVYCHHFYRIWIILPWYFQPKKKEITRQNRNDFDSVIHETYEKSGFTSIKNMKCQMKNESKMLKDTHVWHDNSHAIVFFFFFSSFFPFQCKWNGNLYICELYMYLKHDMLHAQFGTDLHFRCRICCVDIRISVRCFFSSVFFFRYHNVCSINI